MYFQALVHEELRQCKWHFFFHFHVRVFACVFFKMHINFVLILCTYGDCFVPRYSFSLVFVTFCTQRWNGVHTRKGFVHYVYLWPQALAKKSEFRNFQTSSINNLGSELVNGWILARLNIGYSKEGRKNGWILARLNIGYSKEGRKKCWILARLNIGFSKEGS